ncbi:MAG: hypothetical protein HC887_02960 [Desulfobacteraceae bacterium]|nr:hypothetical protein [Desulfobacteraceae bacterium]
MASFVIFYDSTLKELVQYQPQTLEEMEQIHGIGQRKLERYGERILDIIREHVRQHGIRFQAENLPGIKKPVEKQIHHAKSDKLSPTMLETLSLFKTGKSPEEIAESRNFAVSTIYGHLSEIIADGQLSAKDVVRLNDDEILEITNACQSLSEDPKQRLKPVFEQLEGKYSYGIIRCVIAGLMFGN